MQVLRLPVANVSNHCDVATAVHTLRLLQLQLTLCMRHAARVLLCEQSSFDATLCCVVYLSQQALASQAEQQTASTECGAVKSTTGPGLAIDDALVRQVKAWTRALLSGDYQEHLYETGTDNAHDINDDSPADDRSSHSKDSNDSHNMNSRSWTQSVSVVVVPVSAIPRDALVEVEVSALTTIAAANMPLQYTERRFALNASTTPNASSTTNFTVAGMSSVVDALPFWSDQPLPLATRASSTTKAVQPTDTRDSIATVAQPAAASVSSSASFTCTESTAMHRRCISTHCIELCEAIISNNTSDPVTDGSCKSRGATHVAWIVHVLLVRMRAAVLQSEVSPAQLHTLRVFWPIPAADVTAFGASNAGGATLTDMISRSRVSYFVVDRAIKLSVAADAVLSQYNLAVSVVPVCNVQTNTNDIDNAAVNRVLAVLTSVDLIQMDTEVWIARRH